MPLPPDLAGGPFTTADLLDRGLQRGVLDGPRVRRVLRGVHLAREVDLDLALAVAAARRVLPTDALLTGTSALRWAGAAVGPLEPLHFVSRHPHQVRRPGLRVSRAQVLPPSSAGVVEGADAFVLAAHELDLVELVTAGDHLVRVTRCPPGTLVRTAATARGRGVVLARRAAGLVRERVDSPHESELRLCLLLAGLPELEPDVVVGREAPIGRFDLVHRLLRVAVEYEGDQHRTDRTQWNRDIDRHEALAREGWRLVRVTGERMARPTSVVAAVLSSLRDAGYAGPDPVLSPEWRTLFGSSACHLRLQHAFRPSWRALG